MDNKFIINEEHENKKNLERALTLREKLSQSDSGLCNFGYIYSNEEHPATTFKSQACYGGLFGPHMDWNKRNDTAILFSDWCFSGKQRKETGYKYRDIIDWIVNKSMFADLYITKDVEEIIAKGAILRTHMPIRFMIQPMIMIRCLVEMPKSIGDSCALFFNKGDNHLALLLSHYMSQHYMQIHKTYKGWEKRYDNGCIYFLSGGGHTCFYPMSTEMVKRFLTQDFSIVNKEEPFSIKPCGYTNISSCWGDFTGYSKHFKPSGAEELRLIDTYGYSTTIFPYGLDNIEEDMKRWYKELTE